MLIRDSPMVIGVRRRAQFAVIGARITISIDARRARITRREHASIRGPRRHPIVTISLRETRFFIGETRSAHR
jgi:hypothetical protein